MVCFFYSVHVGLLMVVCWFLVGGLAVGRQSNSIFTSAFSV